MAAVPEWAEGALLADGHEEALIGFGTQFNTVVAVYDYDAALENLTKQFTEACGCQDFGDCDHPAEAEEWMSFNVLGGYVGPQTPIWVKAVRCDGCFIQRKPLDADPCLACGSNGVA